MPSADTPLGLVVLFGLTWSLVYHFLNGMRHLAWDLGYGFDKQDAERNSVIIFALSVLGALAVFALGLDRPCEGICNEHGANSAAQSARHGFVPFRYRPFLA